MWTVPQCRWLNNSSVRVHNTAGNDYLTQKTIKRTWHTLSDVFASSSGIVCSTHTNILAEKLATRATTVPRTERTVWLFRLITMGKLCGWTVLEKRRWITFWFAGAGRVQRLRRRNLIVLYAYRTIIFITFLFWLLILLIIIIILVSFVIIIGGRASADYSDTATTSQQLHYTISKSESVCLQSCAVNIHKFVFEWKIYNI